MDCRHPLAALILVTVTACFLSCATSNPNLARVLTSIAVTPEFADAQTYPLGQVVFKATGTYSLAPLTGPVTSAPPYLGQFSITNSGTTIATIIATGNGTATVQCAAGASGTVIVAASAYANNGTTTVVSGNAQLTCP